MKLKSHTKRSGRKVWHPARTLEFIISFGSFDIKTAKRQSWLESLQVGLEDDLDSLQPLVSRCPPDGDSSSSFLRSSFQLVDITFLIS
ncbi:hypothetical protein HZ326_22020 [Fusarium oxysporum f. sp. albedinis]|nr:hypothetical protein HZ326_22020 [Fusarium oxysporum f. sp. albedinis]